MQIKHVKLNNGNKMPMFIFGTNMLSKQMLYDVVKKALEEGCRAFDTAPNYPSSVWLGEIFRDLLIELNIKREELFIQTKLDWLDMQNNRIHDSFYEMLKTMQLEYVDSYVMHWPQPDTYVSSWKEMEKLYKKGLVKNIGTCNFLLRHWDIFFRSDIEIVPQINQIELHPLRTCENLVDFCSSKGIVTQSYSPLCKMLQPIKESLVLKELSFKYKCTIPTLILAWHICRGVVPINKTTKSSRIVDNITCLSLNLENEDVLKISKLNQDYKLIVESIACPGF